MSELDPCWMCGAPWAQMCQEKDARIAELERELAMNGAQMAGDSALIRGLKQENARLREAILAIHDYDMKRARPTGWQCDFPLFSLIHTAAKIALEDAE